MLISSLKNQKAFDSVNKSGKKLRSPYFIAVIAKNSNKIASNQLNMLVFGMKVGKKLGKAVIRNKIKRRIRHMINLLSKDQIIKQSNWQMIIIPKKGFETIEFSSLLKEMARVICAT